MSGRLTQRELAELGRVRQMTQDALRGTGRTHDALASCGRTSVFVVGSYGMREYAERLRERHSIGVGATIVVCATPADARRLFLGLARRHVVCDHAVSPEVRREVMRLGSAEMADAPTEK